MGREQSRRDRLKGPGSGRGCCPDFRLEHLVLHSLSPKAEYQGHRPLLRTRAHCLQAQRVLTTESWQQSRRLGKAIFPRVAWLNDWPTQHAPIKDQSQGHLTSELPVGPARDHVPFCSVLPAPSLTGADPKSTPQQTYCTQTPPQRTRPRQSASCGLLVCLLLQGEGWESGEEE